MSPARAARRAALKTYRKFSQTRDRHRHKEAVRLARLRLMCDTVASLDGLQRSKERLHAL